MNRINNYNKLNVQLNYISDDEIIKIIGKTKKSGFGANTTIEIDKIKIFVKSIILTELEYKNKYNTSNLFNLPLYYNYGIGSYGINCWREVLMHIKTTNYVLNGECENFPLLYHYRIIETKSTKINFNLSDFKYWNSNNNIKNYIDAKSKSKYKILLFIEYFPKVLQNWLLENKNNIHSFYKQSLNIINFLNLKNIIHFDTHNGNFVVDSNNTIYLTDYGLVLDKDFNLSKKELIFYNKNKYYDYGLLSLVIIWYLVDIVSDTKNKQFYEDKLNIIFTKNINYTVVENIILLNYNFIFNNEKIKKPNKLSVLMEIADIYINFMRLIIDNNKKNNIFPNEQIKKIYNNFKV